MKQNNINIAEILENKVKCKFKPFDKVLVRDTYLDCWCVDLFSYIDKYGDVYCTGNISWGEYIPYNEQTAHLVGTTDNYKEN